MIWGYDLEIYEETGLRVPLRLSTSTHCHALITGASGSGKSYALLFLLGQILQSDPHTVIYFCDFKNSEDFSFLSGYVHYYAGNACYDGIMAYYEAFTNARTLKQHSDRFLLICDEYPAFLNYLQGQDKVNKTKLSGDVLTSVSEILMLGRGIGFGIWIVTQRADASLFSNGARDNFMAVVGLGRMSKEQRGMVFTGEDIPDRIFQQGEACLLADGRSLRLVRFPRLSDVCDWKQHILSALMRQGGT